jgi:hypothetical protein
MTQGKNYLYFLSSLGGNLNLINDNLGWFNRIYIGQRLDSITFDGITFNNVSQLDFNQTSRNSFYLKNYNTTTRFTYQITPLTSALLTNGTSLCNGSSSNLALNTGDINITLQPNEGCWVLDNFNHLTDYDRLSSLIGTTNADNLYLNLGFFHSYDTGICSGFMEGMSGLAGAIFTFLLLAGLVVIVSIIGIVIYKVRTMEEGGEASYNENGIEWLGKFLIGLAVVVILAVTMVIMLGGIC